MVCKKGRKRSERRQKVQGGGGDRKEQATDEECTEISERRTCDKNRVTHLSACQCVSQEVVSRVARKYHRQRYP